MFSYFNSDPKIPIAARTIAVIHAKVGPVAPVPGTQPGNALLVYPGDHRRQVWVRASYAGYRDAFLKVHLPFFGGAVGVSGMADMQVDHIFNRARSQVLGYEYVRLFLCPKDTNERHGRFLEKRLTEMERRLSVNVPPASRGDIVFASNWTIAKMAGIAVDRADPTYDQDQALRWLRANDFI